MRSNSSLSFAGLLLLASAGAAMTSTTTGCTTASDEAGSADQAVTTAADIALAKEVVDMLGGTEGKCKQCHGVTEAKIKAWGTTLSTIDAACFAADLEPMKRIDCLRTDPANPSSGFSARKLGLYAAGVQQEQFKALFQSAFPADSWEREYASFTQRTSMPRGGEALTAEEFAKIKGWVLRGMPALPQAFGAPADPDPGTACVPSTTPELQAHIQAMKTQGWGARLADQATPMFGCADANALGCLSTLPDATTTFGAQNVPQTLRTLIDQDLESHYWVRSSADGRYVGFGFNESARVVDLKNPAKPIAVEADYDPFFLPSNDGFAFAGSHGGGQIVLCKQSLLSDVASSADPRVNLDERKCAEMGEEVYMSIGTALDGVRYFMTHGAHANDDGGHDITTQLPADFGADAETSFIPMVNNGQSYKAKPGTVVKLPNEGDLMLSPSSQLAAARFGDESHSLGYHVRLVKPTQSAAGALSVETPLAATVCIPGQKANISFNERFMATHQYVDRSQADQAELPEGSSNIVLADLLTGKVVRITTTKKSQFALYPHFRADGWLYFLVRDMDESKEYVVASDAALRIEAGTP